MAKNSESQLDQTVKDSTADPSKKKGRVRFSEQPDPVTSNENGQEKTEKETNENETPTELVETIQEENPNYKYCDICRPGWRPKFAVNVVHLPQNFWGRQALLEWYNERLDAEFTAIEHLGTGVAYCLLTEVLFPTSVSFIDINWQPTRTREYIQNFRILKTSFKKLHVNKDIPALKLSLCGTLENLEFAWWFKNFFELNYKGLKFCGFCRGRNWKSHK